MKPQGYRDAGRLVRIAELLAAGWKLRAIAEVVGVCPSVVCRVLKRDVREV